MRLGIDLGTTRVVTAYVDRGNYPVVVFDAPDGSSSDWFPPLIAVRGDERLYGWKAWQAQQEPGWTILRSVKRLLEEAGPETRIEIGGQSIPMQQLLTELVGSLREHLLGGSNLPASAKSEPLEVMLGVPAHAHSNQRFLTVEAFRQAGFQVLGLLNEPSAASIEYGHRNRKARGNSSSSRILVYDLGGGTFDASLVELGDTVHYVIASEGIGTLGGDDFDEIMADLALDAAGLGADERNGLTQAEMFRLHEECRQKKEALHPNTKRLAVDLGAAREGWPEVSLTTEAFYERCRPLIQETLHAVEDLLDAAKGEVNGANGDTPSGGEARLEALYVTGGASELPLVSRLLREGFGGRVKRSAYTRSATAIGLAIQADAQAGYRLSEKFTRYFGVWREAEGGRSVIFDPLFVKGTSLPVPGDPPLERSRRYAAVHNVGHYRYLECSHLTDEGRPAGDITVWDDIRFPFDVSLRDQKELKPVEVSRMGGGTMVEAEERYSCDAGGGVAVTISSLTGGYDRSYRLGRWSAEEPPIVPGKRRTAKLRRKK
ncbi:MAG TPA: Hsp70 family protein [Terriglobia bacterium]|nr:Hsp70 family protein [Terriglobia bacterium]